MLVRAGGRWQVDDVVDPKYGSVMAGIAQAAEPAAHTLGAAVGFGPVASIAPRVRFSAAVLQASPCASRDCPPHTTDLPNSSPIMKIDVRMVETAPCRNEKAISIAAPGTNLSQPP